MHAPAYHCPACGGPSRSHGPGSCDFCGAVRVPLGVPDPRTAKPCPGCLALVSTGDAFCNRCGAAQGTPDPPTLEHGLPCPGCGTAMSTWAHDLGLDLGEAAAPGYRGGEARIQGCRSCGGAWIDRHTLTEMITRAAAIATAIDPSGVRRATMSMSADIVYRNCPGCGHQMSRRNFARYSGVVVDECRTCGTYFDAGELEAVFAFVRTGGLALRDRRDAGEAARVQRAISMARPPAEPPQAMRTGTELDLVVWFLRWLGRWLWRDR